MSSDYNDDDAGVVQLPARESEILALAAKGYTDRQISAELGISADTVGTYWRRILLRFKASNRTEVVARASQARVNLAERESERLAQELERRDLSELKTAEALAQLNTILNTFDSAVIFVDASRIVQFANDSFCKEFAPGLEPAQLIGASGKEFMPKFATVFEDPIAHARRAEEIIAKGEALRNDEIQTADGRRFLRDFYPLQRDGERVGHVWKFRPLP